jgi:ribosome-associated protein
MNLDQFLKWSGVTATGGQAKVLIQAGHVRVNGEVETRRGRGLKPGDRVEAEGQTLIVPEVADPDADGG